MQQLHGTHAAELGYVLLRKWTDHIPRINFCHISTRIVFQSVTLTWSKNYNLHHKRDLSHFHKFKAYNYMYTELFFLCKLSLCRSQWPRGLRRRSAAARLLRSWVRIPPGEWMFVCCECCVLSGRGLCDELITRPDESYRPWYVVVCDLETSSMRRPWPTLGIRARENKLLYETKTITCIINVICPIFTSLKRTIYTYTGFFSFVNYHYNWYY